jgi:hypothetical protein
MQKHIETEVKKRVKGEARKKVQMEKADICPDTGAEILDPQPLYQEVGFKAPPSINDKIREITMQVQAQTAATLAAQNLTQDDVKRILDEEDDFDIPEEYEARLTSYEMVGALSDIQEDPPTLVAETPPSPPAKQEEPETAPKGDASESE